MKVAMFLSVASIVAIVTIVVGLALTGQPNWHFTILDVVTDVGGGIIFGAVALGLSTYWTPNRMRVHLAINAVLVAVGILSVLTIAGGAARALIFGS